MWGSSLLEEVPRRFRSLYTVELPLKYATIAVFAIIVLISRSAGVIGRVSSGQYSDLWTLAICLLAFACIGAVAFRLERLEFWLTITLCSGLVTYPIANIIIGVHEHDLRQMALGIVLFQLVYFPGWRIFDIARTSRRRDASPPRRSNV